MYQIIEQTDEEKMTMYMKLSKKEIISMLIETSKFIDRFTPIVETEPRCNEFFPDFRTTVTGCLYCGKMANEHKGIY